MASTLKNLIRKLNLSDFHSNDQVSKPAPGTHHHVAETAVKVGTMGLKTEFVGGKYRIKDSLMVDIQFDPRQSWVADFVSGESDEFQSQLLKHEQAHYDIAALLARDFFLAVMKLITDNYPYSTSNEPIADVNQAKQVTLDKMQIVNDQFDADTYHGMNKSQQDRWLGFIQSAFTQRVQPQQTVANNNQLMVPLLKVLKDNHVSI